MKRLLLVLFCFSAYAADNTITVDQVGDNNTISITQDGAGHSATLTLGKTSAADNTNINITQQGTGAKTATVEIPAGINNGVVMFQDGAGNHTANIQNLIGSANNIGISQTGAGSHSMTITGVAGTTNNNNSVDVTQSGGAGADKTFNLWLNGATGAGVTVQQTNPTQANQGGMNIQCNPCGSGWSYIRN
jgi:Curlin associated repeat